MAKINVTKNPKLLRHLMNFQKAVWTVFQNKLNKTVFQVPFAAVSAAIKNGKLGKTYEGDTLKMHLNTAYNALQKNPDLITARPGYTYGNLVSSLPAAIFLAMQEIDRTPPAVEAPAVGLGASGSIEELAELFYKKVSEQ